VAACGQALQRAAVSYEAETGKSVSLHLGSQVLWSDRPFFVFVFAEPAEPTHAWLRENPVPADSRWLGLVWTRTEAHAFGQVRRDAGLEDAVARWFVPAIDRCFEFAAMR
jgi:hypothetical protein